MPSLESIAGEFVLGGETLDGYKTLASLATLELPLLRELASSVTFHPGSTGVLTTLALPSLQYCGNSMTLKGLTNVVHVSLPSFIGIDYGFFIQDNPVLETIQLGSRGTDVLVGREVKITNLPKLRNLDFFYNMAYMGYGAMSDDAILTDLPSVTSAAGLCGVKQWASSIEFHGNFTKLCRAAVTVCQ